MMHRAVLLSLVMLFLAARTTQGGQNAELLRELKPLSIRGVNYMPRDTPWGGMWTKTPSEVWEQDMALAASLGCNTVRTFLMFSSQAEQAGLLNPDGSLTAAYHTQFEQLLAAAWRHGIRLIVCFEFSQQWLAAPDAAARSQRTLADIVGAHRTDGRVLLWDLMNEPEDDAKWTAGTRAYLQAALPFVKQLDSQHLTTVGLTWRVDRLQEVGLPDVMQYHEYSPKQVLFERGAARVREVIDNVRNSSNSRPLLIGEFGMCTARDPQHGVTGPLQAKLAGHPGSEAEQARIYETVLQAAQQDRIAGVLAWCLHDYAIENPNEAHFGLVRRDGTLKPAAQVLRQAFVRWQQLEQESRD